MDDLDEGLIKLTNHKDHPTNKAYKVFFFYKKQQAEHFEKILVSKKIPFEKGEEDSAKGDVYMFGTRKTDNQEVLKINYETLGKYRSPFITNKWAQYIVLLLGIGLVVFSLISYFQNN